MAGEQSKPHREVTDLRATVTSLQDTIRAMELERQQVIDQRRRRLLLVGGSLSLVLHAVLLIFLSMWYVGSGRAGATPMATYEFAILNQEELTELEQIVLEEQLQEEPMLDEEASIEPVELSPVTPATEFAPGGVNSLPALSASGGSANEELDLGGGGGGASFFGVTSKGTRFAYIVDVSGSMGQDRKMDTAMRELARSIDSLPDYAHFYILLFSTEFVMPPMQTGWMKARKSTVRQFIRWLSTISPTGGTQPRSAFYQVYSLEVRPDVIFFLTDGEIEDFTAEELASLNSRGKKTVINTIAFGDPSSQELLRHISRQSGGVYRFVKSEVE